MSPAWSQLELRPRKGKSAVTASHHVLEGRLFPTQTKMNFPKPAYAPFVTCHGSAFGKPARRLGLASRGVTQLSCDDVLAAIEQGVNFVNWPGASEGPAVRDSFSSAIAELGPRREDVVVSIQLAARDASDARDELQSVLRVLGTDYVDVVTLYYVEQEHEWNSLSSPDGVCDYCRAAQADGTIRRLGITSHRRPLAAKIAASGLVDLVMIRYNAAHRGAEREVFPVTEAHGVPVIAYTALRWGALLQSTPLDPPGYQVPTADAWYRFVLQSPSVSVVLAAPDTRQELDQALSVLRADGPLPESEWNELAAHGARVRATAGSFP